MFKYQKFVLKKCIICTAIIIFAILALAKILSVKRELPVYVGTEEESTGIVYTIDTVQINSSNVTMEIPDGWVYVNNNGTDRYIDTNSQSYIDIITQEYYPEVNTFLSEDFVSSRISSIGGIKTGFKSISSSCVYYMFQKNVGSVPYNVCSYISWDFANVNEIDICIPTQYYADYTQLPEYLINKIKCAKSTPISEDYYVYYENNTNTQFGVPVSWNFANNGQIVLSNGNAEIIIGTSSITEFSSLTTLQYNQMVGSSVPNFVLSSFNPTQNILTAEANYTNNGTKMYMKQCMMSAGNRSLVFTLSVPASLKSDTILAVFDTVTGYYQYFGN